MQQKKVLHKQSFPLHTRHLSDKLDQQNREKAIAVGYDPYSYISVDDFLRNISKEQHDGNLYLNENENCIS
eukprot:Pgem_evm1s9914